MKQLLIYDRPVPLDRELHKSLFLHSVPGDLTFAGGTNSVPLVGAEFARAACEYPILFAGDSVADVIPAALLGLRATQNLMLSVDGQWVAGAYIPAFLRRYPFVLAEKPDPAEGFTVCLDEAFTGLNTQGNGQALFLEDGGHSPFLTNALGFLEEYQAHLQRTRAFTTKLAQLNLLVPKAIQVQPAHGQAFSIDGFFVVDEEKLRALKGKPLQELLRSGDLGWVHVHLMSLVNVERLTRRLDAATPHTH